MNINTFLNRLDKVKKVGKDKWIACCPAHNDKSPSLSIKHGNDGRILVYCHAACPTDEIVNALDLELSDLFAESIRPVKHYKFSRTQMEEALSHELLILLINLNRRHDFKHIKHDDYVRERLAAHRVCKLVGELYV